MSARPAGALADAAERRALGLPIVRNADTTIDAVAGPIAQWAMSHAKT